MLLGGTYKKVAYKEKMGVFDPKTLLCQREWFAERKK